MACKSRSPSIASSHQLLQRAVNGTVLTMRVLQEDDLVMDLFVVFVGLKCSATTSKACLAMQVPLRSPLALSITSSLFPVETDRRKQKICNESHMDQDFRHMSIQSFVKSIRAKGNQILSR